MVEWLVIFLTTISLVVGIVIGWSVGRSMLRNKKMKGY